MHNPGITKSAGYRESVVLAVIIWLALVPHAVGANVFQEFVLFDGGIPAEDQGYSTVGPEYQEILVGQSLDFVVRTTGEPSAISGVFGPTPNLGAAAPGSWLTVAANVPEEFHSGSDDAGFSVILIGDDPAESIHVAFRDGSLWYYDAEFAAQPVTAIPGGSLIFRLVFEIFEDSAELSYENLLDLPLPLVDYRTNAHTRHPTIAPLYDQPNTVFVGDESPTASSGFFMGFIAHNTVVPVPAASVLMIPAMMLLSRFGRRA